MSITEKCKKKKNIKIIIIMKVTSAKCLCTLMINFYKTE